MTKKTILGTGLSGLLGSRVLELLSNYQFQNLSRQTGVDISQKEQVFDAVANSSSDTVMHLAAFTKVDEAEKEKDLREQSMAWQINVLGTKNVLEACEKYNKKIIYFSTDMVFPGDNKLPEKYLEEDITGAVGFYAKTKEEAEKLVEKATCPWVILRIAYPYRASFEKADYVRIFKDLLEKESRIQAVSDHYFTPTFIDDIAKVIDLIVNNNLTGKIHAVGQEIISPFEAAVKIAEIFNLNVGLIEKTTRESFFEGKAPRGYNLSLNNDKIKKLGIQMTSFSEGLEKIKAQMNY
jgi:dTDP-4-dehydrorhamnose reductase